MKTEDPSITPSTSKTQGCHSCPLTARTRSSFQAPEHGLAGQHSARIPSLSGQNLCRGACQSRGQVGGSQNGNPVREGRGQRPEKQHRRRGAKDRKEVPYGTLHQTGAAETTLGSVGVYLSRAETQVG